VPDAIPAEFGAAGERPWPDEVAGTPDAMPEEFGAAAVSACPELVASVPEAIPPELGAAGPITWFDEVAVTLVGITGVEVGEMARTIVNAAKPADSSIPVRVTTSARRRVTGIPFISTFPR